MSNRIKVAAIVGPTASGKSALSLEIAKALDGEIISCDSMQLYRGMNIGTAKPSDSERALVPHHMIDIVDAGENFSCADYAELAKEKIREISSRGKLPILCGGTGLYLDSVLRGGSFEETKIDMAYREKLYELAKTQGNLYIHSMLKEIDLQAAEAIHPNNVKRVIRALEIYKTSGVTKTEADRRSREGELLYDSLVIGLRYSDREVLYRKIDKRVDKMMDDGLLDEVRALENKSVFEKSNTASQAIGYKELLGYLHGSCSAEAAVEELKRATRHYAKRQMTWFSTKKDIIWIDLDEKFGSDSVTFEKIVNNIIKLFYDKGFYDIM